MWIVVLAAPPIISQFSPLRNAGASRNGGIEVAEMRLIMRRVKRSGSGSGSGIVVGFWE